MNPASAFDPRFLVPSGARQVLLMGSNLQDCPYPQAELPKKGDRLDALIVLSPLPLEQSLAIAKTHLIPGGTLVVCLRSPGHWILDRLFPGVESLACDAPALRHVRQKLKQAGFQYLQGYGWISTTRFPYLMLPLDEKRMLRFAATSLLPRGGRREALFKRLAPLLSPAWIAPYRFIVAERAPDARTSVLTR